MDNNLLKRMVYCLNCDYAIAKSELQAMRVVSVLCPRCGRFPVNEFYEYGSTAHIERYNKWLKKEVTGNPPTPLEERKFVLDEGMLAEMEKEASSGKRLDEQYAETFARKFHAHANEVVKRLLETKPMKQGTELTNEELTIIGVLAGLKYEIAIHSQTGKVSYRITDRFVIVLEGNQYKVYKFM